MNTPKIMDLITISRMVNLTSLQYSRAFRNSQFTIRMICINYVNGGVLFCLKLTEQKPTKQINLFEVSSPFIKHFMYGSLGVLAGLLLIGTLWDVFLRKKRGTHQNTVLGEDKHFIMKFQLPLYKL